MSVGLYGGSFNPAHEGHAHVANTARERLGLDRVIWLVSPQNPLKAPGETRRLDHRMAGAAARARGRSMIVSDAERRIGSRYTIDTLRVLKARFPGVRFVWIMGADSLAGFHAWRGWTQILREVPVAVVSRPGYELKSRFSPAARRFAFARIRSNAAGRLAGLAPPAWVYLRGPLNFASSTARRVIGSSSQGPIEERPLNPDTAPDAPVSSEATPSDPPRLDLAGRTPLETLILNRLDDEKAQDIVYINLKDKSSIADGLVVASGRSHRHVGAMADHLLRALKEAGHGKARVEGLPHCDWVLIDAGDVIVHLFRPEVRVFYNIEKIWSIEPPSRAAAN